MKSVQTGTVAIGLGFPIAAGAAIGVAAVAFGLPATWAVALVGAGPLAALLSLILAKHPIILLSGLAVAIPTNLNLHLTYRPHIGVADGITIEAIDLALVVLAARLFALRLARSDYAMRWFPHYTIPILIMLTAELVSVTRAADAELAMYGWQSHLREAALFWILANSLTEVRQLQAVEIGAAIGVLMIGAICAAEVITQTNFAVEVNEAIWGPFRAAGRNTPTMTAGYLAAMISIFLAGLLRPSLSGPHKMLFALAAFAGTAGMLFTLTRAAWAAGAAGAVVALTVPVFHPQRRRVGLAFVAALLVVLLPLTWMYRNLVEERFSDGPGNAIARLGMLQTTAAMVEEQPWTGIGINNYNVRFEEFRRHNVLHAFEYMVHNKFALIVAESGVIALLAFLAILARAFWDCARLARYGAAMGQTVAAGLLGSLVSFALHMNFESYSGGPAVFAFWMIVGCVAASAARDEPSHES